MKTGNMVDSKYDHAKHTQYYDDWVDYRKAQNHLTASIDTVPIYTYTDNCKRF